MTQEEKQLLLIDLCARLPYGVKVSLNKNNIGDLTAVYPFDGCAIIENLKDKIPITDFYSSDYGRFTIEEGEVKPYLRPMSSMTEKEMRDWWAYKQIGTTWEDQDSRSVDWLNAHHFDYRGLIEKGLAIEAEARDGMKEIYKNE